MFILLDNERYCARRLEKLICILPKQVGGEVRFATIPEELGKVTESAFPWSHKCLSLSAGRVVCAG